VNETKVYVIDGWNGRTERSILVAYADYSEAEVALRKLLNRNREATASLKTHKLAGLVTVKGAILYALDGWQDAKAKAYLRLYLDKAKAEAALLKLLDSEIEVWAGVVRLKVR
jgi:hypothetical protein